MGNLLPAQGLLRLPPATGCTRFCYSVLLILTLGLASPEEVHADRSRSKRPRAAPSPVVAKIAEEAATRGGVPVAPFISIALAFVLYFTLRLHRKRRDEFERETARLRLEIEALRTETARITGALTTQRNQTDQEAALRIATTEELKQAELRLAGLETRLSEILALDPEIEPRARARAEEIAQRLAYEAKAKRIQAKGQEKLERLLDEMKSG